MSKLVLFPDVANKKDYDFEIFYRDTDNGVLQGVTYPYSENSKNKLTYYVYKDNNIFIVESQVKLHIFFSPIDIGLLDHSGLYKTPFLNKDYINVLDDKNCWILMDDKLYNDARKRGEFCEYFENLVKPFYRKKKIDKLLKK